MRRLFRNFGLMAAGLAATLSSAPAHACSVAGDYRVPTNLELAERADTILLGMVEDGPADGGGMDGANLVIRPTLLLKGHALPPVLRIGGMIADKEYAIASDPDELQQAHPLSYIGGCIRYMFVKGSTILLFLERQDGELQPISEPFSRYAEDVPSPDSRWVKAVRIYIEVAALPEGERRAALLVRQQALATLKDDADAQAIAADIERQLAGPNPSWNALMMQEINRRGQ